MISLLIVLAIVAVVVAIIAGWFAACTVVSVHYAITPIICESGI